MILKSSRIRATSRVAGDVVAHLLNGDQNEAVRILQGTPADVYDMVADARRLSKVFAFRHFVISPETMTSAEALVAVVAALGSEFGFDPATAFVVEHHKERATGAVTNHIHAIVPEVDAAGRVLSSAHSFPRQEKIARISEARLGHPPVLGAHHRAVLAALRAEGHVEVATALDRAFPDTAEAQPLAAYSDRDHAAAKGRGIDLPTARGAVVEAWKYAATRAELESALAARGLVCKPGDKPGTWIVQSASGHFVGSLARLANARKAAVLERMEPHHVEPIPTDRRHDDGGGHVPDGSLNSTDDPPAGDPCSARRGNIRDGRMGGAYDRDHGGAPRRANSPPARSGAVECATGRPGDGSPAHGIGSSSVASLAQATSAAMGLLMAIARPQHTSRILALQAAANREAKSAHQRALDGLAHVQEEAEIAARIAARAIEPSAAVKAAEEEARQAEASAKVANREAAAAGARFYEHLAKRPSGWRRAIAWVTGANIRHDNRATELKQAKEAAERRAEDSERASGTAGRRAEQARDADAREAKDLREKRRQNVRYTGPRSEAAVRALHLLEQRPALAGMGLEPLLQLGRRLLSQESTPPTDPSDVSKPRLLIPTG